jgi:hypothetical protein
VVTWRRGDVATKKGAGGSGAGCGPPPGSESSRDLCKSTGRLMDGARVRGGGGGGGGGSDIFRGKWK